MRSVVGPYRIVPYRVVPRKSLYESGLAPFASNPSAFQYLQDLGVFEPSEGPQQKVHSYSRVEICDDETAWHRSLSEVVSSPILVHAREPLAVPIVHPGTILEVLDVDAGVGLVLGQWVSWSPTGDGVPPLPPLTLTNFHC